MTEYLVQMRLFKEQRDIREFIQPRSWPVLQLAAGLPRTPADAALVAWRRMAERVHYPPREPFDYHYAEEFVRTRPGIKIFEQQGAALVSDQSFDYWSFPAETLAVGVGDCEDCTFLLTSVLRNVLGPTQVYATIGLLEGGGHAWVTVLLDGVPYRLETTRPPFGASDITRELPPYEPYFRFNDLVAEELRPGLLEGFGPRFRVAALKLFAPGRGRDNPSLPNPIRVPLVL